MHYTVINYKANDAYRQYADNKDDALIIVCRIKEWKPKDCEVIIY